MMDIRDLLRCWGFWLRNMKLEKAGSPKLASSRLNQMMAGQMEKGYCAPVYGSVVFAGIELNQETDRLYSAVDKAIAKLPKRRREVVMIEYYFCVNGTQEQKCCYMQPAIKQNTYSELLKLALNQLANSPDVKALLKKLAKIR